ncbi:hypothetical protein SZ55_4956 [Pseudomonas sp. FeS53a]|nr:hypothetical protein SZ55_4956 [Pseudomonas sp. FeS53a]
MAELHIFGHGFVRPVGAGCRVRRVRGFWWSRPPLCRSLPIKA